ncbi:MAG: molybdopterin molybdenumtransferase MoeA [Thermoprotei archaeon]|nr:MAG: molybdopterin molybdenumtransferase MoeA [Thermoprotei archaeon]
MWKLTRVHRAVEEVSSLLKKNLSITDLPLEEALNKICGADIVSDRDFPPYMKATMDGYAVRSEDCEEASYTSPALVKLLPYHIYSGQLVSVKIGAGEGVAIETGGFLPEGADSVVRVEDTSRRNNEILIYRKVSRYENVSLPGEELAKGDLVLKRGDLIRPWHLAALEALGFATVPVIDVKASIICTGDEFVKGKAVPFTRRIVEGWLREHSIEVSKILIARDNSDEIADLLETLLKENDIVVLCGGSSLGSKDYSVRAVRKLEPEAHVHGIAIQPGKTTALSSVRGRLVVNLSGLPVAALAGLELVVKPVLEKWIGVEYLPRPIIKAKLTKRITVKLGFMGFVRVRVFRRNSGFYAEPLTVGGSGSLRSLVLGNGFVVVPEDIEGYDEGEVVGVEVYGRI